MILRSCLSFLLAASAWGQFYGPQFRVIPRSNGSATGEMQFFGLTGANYLGLRAPSSVPTTLVWNLPTTDSVGALCSDGALNLYIGCVGGASGVTTLNTLTAPVQSLGNGVTGTAPNWTTASGTTHILNIPFASTSGVTAGLISNTNFAAFTAKQDAVSASPPITFSANTVACPTCVTGTVSASNTPNTIALRDGAGGIVANIAYLTQGLLYPASAATALFVRRGTSGQTDPLQTWADQTGSALSTIDKDGNFTGRSATSLALAANPANCSAGQAAAGVDASGAAEGCFTPAGSGGNVNGSGTTVVGEVPAYTNTTATAIGPGYSVSTSNTANALARRDGAGGLVANIGYFTSTLVSPVSAATAIAARRGTSGQTDPIQTWATEAGATLSAIDKDGKFTGNAATATALAANGANCSAGQAAAGVDASGAAEGCFTPAGGGNVSGSGTTVVGEVPAFTNTTSTAIGPGYAVSSSGSPNALARYGSGGGMTSSLGYWVGGTNVINDVRQAYFPLITMVGEATGHVLWSQVYANNSSNKHITFRNASGAELSYIDYQGNFTGRAATASALAANPTNCSAGQAAAGVAADGTAEGCFTPSGGGGSNLGIYNVKDSPYNAVGDGSNDDTVEIQAAIDACHDSTRGGIVFVPPGTYNISATLYQGNGNGNTVSTKKPCHIKGSGGGPGPASTSTAIGASVIKWTGSAPGSTTYAFEMRGPFVGGGISEITFDLNDKSNLRGVLWENVSHGWSHNLSIINYRSTGLVLTSRSTDSGPDYGTCDNYFSHLRIMRNSTGGSGMSLLGNDVSGGRDSCSNTFYAPMFWHDNGTSGTFGLELGFADNNRFFGLNVYGFPEASTNGSGIKFVQQTTNTQFPHENTFMSVSAHQGATGTMGSGQPNIFYDWHLGDCYHNCDPYSVSGSVKPIVFSTDRSLKGVTVPGDFTYSSTDENNETVTINHSSGGQNGAGNIFFKRAGTNMARIKAHYFDGLEFFTSDGSGGAIASKLRLKVSGVLKHTPLTRTTINGLTAEVGDTAFCSDCARDASCTASGTGALAKAITAGAGIGNWVCN